MPGEYFVLKHLTYSIIKVTIFLKIISSRKEKINNCVNLLTNIAIGLFNMRVQVPIGLIKELWIQTLYLYQKGWRENKTIELDSNLYGKAATYILGGLKSLKGRVTTILWIVFNRICGRAKFQTALIELSDDQDIKGCQNSLNRK